MMRHRKEKENLFVWQVNGQDDDERKEDESGHHSEMETDGLADEFSSWEDQLLDQQEQVDGAAEEGSGDDQEDGQREDGLESIGRRCEQVERPADSLHSALVLAEDRR